MQRYDDETRAQAISDWMAGASLRQVAESHGVPVTTVQGWVKGRTRTPAVHKNNEPAYDLDQMAWELVGDSFAALRSILRKAQDDSWLQEQDANNLAIFFGVTSDKLIRLLAARRDDGDTREPAAIAGPEDAGDALSR